MTMAKTFPVIGRVAREINARKLHLKAAAREIGVSAGTLENHLRGEHVRSDSARKYEVWLSGEKSNISVFTPTVMRTASAELVEVPSVPPVPSSPVLVVDIFSGCGGLSAGFDLLGACSGVEAGEHFKTVLAMDNQSSPIEVLNRNGLCAPGPVQVGRRVDLTDFDTESEVLVFYLEHAAKLHADQQTLARLAKLGNGAFPAFLEAVTRADREYIDALTRHRETRPYQEALAGLDRQALLQTSVVGFHDGLRLPMPGRRPPSMPPILWASRDDARSGPARTKRLTRPPASLLADAARDWDDAVRSLESKRAASGKGQLTASARRIRAFSDFLRAPGCVGMRDIWVAWRARRSEARAMLFENVAFERDIRALYEETYPVGVLVGGPPCQGFARIGRGKIRSLRDAQVQVHQSEEAGDARNLLFQRYVLMLEALRPDVFLFENVQHFQSTVKADGREFRATEILADAIAGMSDGALSYAVSSRVVDASRHGIPQTRQRYFMCGVRSDETDGSAQGQADACLTLPLMSEVPLATALSGLPDPEMAGGDSQAGSAMAALAHISGQVDEAGARGFYTRWIRQPAPGSSSPPAAVDAHVARAARTDDAAFFALMGPGKRWMDYRADEASTTTELRGLLEALVSLPEAALAGLRARKDGRVLPDRRGLERLLQALDGSLPIRLMLEQIGSRAGVDHHLLTDTYLAKRDGQHGDWVARMDGTRPSKTMVSHMGKDTYGYVHPWASRTISVREAARVQTFPDWFCFEAVGLTDAFRMIGNAVPPLLSHLIATNVARVLAQKRGQAQAASRRIAAG